MDEVVALLRRTIVVKQLEINKMMEVIELLEGKPVEKKRHKMSREAIERIRTAQKKRWAEKRKADKA